MNALTQTGPATPPTTANPQANPTTLLVIETPTAKSVHATLRDLQKVINADVGERHHAEADILAVANALGLSPLIRQEGERSTNVDYGLPATDAHLAEVFFHVCFLPTIRPRVTGYGTYKEEAPRMAAYMTIYANRGSRMDLPNQ